MSKLRLIILGIGCWLCALNVQSQSLFMADTTDPYWAYEALQIPVLSPKAKKPIVIAVVDDGFRLSHKALQPFLFQNKQEIPNNLIDDDGNGKIDDVCGWDASDQDPDPGITKGLEQQFYHGTYIASCITRVLERAYGEYASTYFKILPIKVLSDHAASPFLVDGYKGVAYAVEMKADIICCAWSGGTPTYQDKAVFKQAEQLGLQVVAAAGNTFDDKPNYPARLDGVISVGGIDGTYRKTKASSFGETLDFVAPAWKVKGAHPQADNAFFIENGTSPASALLTSCLALLMAQEPAWNASMRYEALLNTASHVHDYNPRYKGKLGAGFPNLKKALRYGYVSGEHNALLSKGIVRIERRNKKQPWLLNPSGGYKGMEMSLKASKNGKQTLEIWNEQENTLYQTLSPGQQDIKLKVPFHPVRLKYSNEALLKKPDLQLTYQVETVDSTRLFCSDTTYLFETSGTLEDGSGAESYTHFNSCRWVIDLPKAKRIRFYFETFDTEHTQDLLWFFDGESALRENAMARFSGQELPPTITSRTNKVLIWFVTNGQNSFDGWKLRYEAVYD